MTMLREMQSQRWTISERLRSAEPASTITGLGQVPWEVTDQVGLLGTARNAARHTTAASP